MQVIAIEEKKPFFENPALPLSECERDANFKDLRRPAVKVLVVGGRDAADIRAMVAPYDGGLPTEIGLVDEVAEDEDVGRTDPSVQLIQLLSFGHWDSRLAALQPGF